VAQTTGIASVDSSKPAIDRHLKAGHYE